MEMSKQVVSLWAKRVRNNDWEMTNTSQDYSHNRENATKFGSDERRRIHEELMKPHKKCGDIIVVHSTKENKHIEISSSSVRRIAKSQLDGGPTQGGTVSLQPAAPKLRKIQGDTAHHNKMRLREAEFWISKGQEYVNGLWFADESKMTFSCSPNKKIDIEWTPRGQCGLANWHDVPRHTGQINLFLVISKSGVVDYRIYDDNMKKVHYTNALKKLKGMVLSNAENEDEVTMTCFVHDNLWGAGQPKDKLNETFGEGKWTQYCSEPCYRPHAWKKTPKTKRPLREYLQRCHCEPPDGPIKASYCPKTNLTENCFAQLDRILINLQRTDIESGIGSWPKHGQCSGDREQDGWRSMFWKKKLKAAICVLDEDKEYFKALYKTFITKRCKMYTARRSRGKRLRVSKY